MDLAHGNSSTVETADGGTAGAGRARLEAGTIIIVVASIALLAITVIAQSRGNVGPATQPDPFLGAAAIEFRAGERGLAGTQPDPFLGAAAIEFRAGERGLAGTQPDPFLGAAAIEFRAGERGLAGK
jgi:hypothetical protein